MNTSFLCIVESAADHRDKRIIFFDGVCNLCNSSVQLVLKNDPGAVFLMAPLQSRQSQAFLYGFKRHPAQMESIVLYENGKIYERSTAALHIARRMKGLYPVLAILLIVPVFIRDAVYNWVGRNRYRWFGKKSSCMVPRPEYANRFIFMEGIEEE